MSNATVSKIKPENVNRCQDGYWTHSGYLGNSDQEMTDKQAMEWFDSVGLNCHIVPLDGNASDEIQDRYFEDGDSNISDWEPECGEPGAFLLSIHDTEDGPVAIFGSPKAELEK